MKNLLPLFFSLFFISISFAQTENPERQRKNTIFLEAYKPVFTNSVKYYDKTRIVFFGGDSETRDYNTYSVGMGFEREFKNDIVIRSRFGLTVIDLINYAKLELNIDPDETLINESGFVYEQNYINLFLGLSKRVHLNHEFNIDFGLDLAVISYLDGTDEHYSSSSYRGSDYRSKSQTWSNTNYGKAMSFGIGPIIKPEYRSKMGLNISFEIQYYFMKTISNDKRIQNYRGESIFSQMGMEEVSSSESMEEIDINYSEWSWSEFSPLIRLGYSF